LSVENESETIEIAGPEETTPTGTRFFFIKIVDFIVLIRFIIVDINNNYCAIINRYNPHTILDENNT
jgi:hypothetical protein